MKVYAYMKRGLRHQEGVCEDAVLLENVVLNTGSMELILDGSFLVGVADGVGGSASGEIASGITMLSLAQNASTFNHVDVLKGYMEEVNHRIYLIGEESELCDHMATTFVGLLHTQDASYVIWIGNSRLYQVSEENGSCFVTQLTMDHNQKNDLMKQGKVLEENLRGDALTGYVGMPEERFKSCLSAGQIFMPGTKRFFLTTDGVHDHIDTEQLQDLFCSEKSPTELLQEISNTAIKCGSQDDISIVMLEWEAE